MKKYTIAFFFIIGFSVVSIAQRKGFAGKIHQLQFDLGRIYWGYYEAQYKISIWKHVSLAATAGIVSKEAPVSNNPFGYYGIPTLKKVQFSGNSYGMGVAYNSPTAGMSMPIGFYMGLYYTKTAGQITQVTANNSIYNIYDFNGNLLKLYYGKNFILYRYLTMDIGIAGGVNWGSVIYSSGNNEPPSEITPSVLFWRQTSQMEDLFFNNHFAKFYILPEVKMGYMF